MSDSSALEALMEEITSCFACPRLVEWRERVAAEKRAAFAEDTYWGRPVPSFGDPEARVLVLGLAPAAHGGNRTGRVFTGDRSGDFLFASMHRTGFANQPTSVSKDDGLRLSDAWIAAPVRCAPPANKPTTAERDTCFPFLLRELALLKVTVAIALGGFAWDTALRAVDAMDGLRLRPKPRFAHGAEADLGRFTLLGCYHVSQQNTFTGRLTPEMLDAVFQRARSLAEARG